MTRHVGRSVLLAVLLTASVALAGCQVGGPSAGDTGTETRDGFADPETDVVGWEDGIWYDEPIDVDQSDGLSDAELRAFVSRSMARVEQIRDREFRSRVPVEVISRAAYRNQSDDDGANASYGAWNNQVWEAMFVVGESTDVQSLLTETLDAAVVGFYEPAADQITIVTTTPDRPTIDPGTLIHELVHAMQDQYHDLADVNSGAATQDGTLAARALVEGEARWVEYAYDRQCEGTWNCVAAAADGGGGGGDGPPNWGVYLTLYFPYSDGPVWLDDVHASGGWDAVADAWADPPTSSEQVIHRTDESPVDVTVADVARGGWERFPSGADTLGEASIFVSFWYQSRTYEAGIVDPGDLTDVESDLDAYDYRSAPSDGWAGDAVVPYRNDGQYGYVWKSRWDTTDDAGGFVNAYREVLRAHDAERLGDGTWRIDDGPFADAFRIVREGDTVTIVNAPTVAALDEIRPRATC